MYELYVRQLPSVLRRCWLGGRKGIWPVKTEWWGAGMVVCLEWGADLHMAQLMPRPLTVSHFSKIQIGFTFLVPAYASSPGKRDVKRVCVCNCQMTITQQHGGIAKFQLYFWLQYQNWYETVVSARKTIYDFQLCNWKSVIYRLHTWHVSGSSPEQY